MMFHQPPFSQPTQMSPQKIAHQLPPQMQSQMMGYAEMGQIDIRPPNAYSFDRSPIKQAPPNMPPQFVPAMPQQAMYTTWNPSSNSFDQENYPAPQPANDNADFPSPSYSRRGTLKRSYSDVAPIQDRNVKRPRIEEDTVLRIPEPHEMPVLVDDGKKPNYSYATMIGMSLLRAPNRKLTLSQIYHWISTTFKYYADDPKQGWHNSIRHNLSLNKAFDKVERPKGDAGKGCYWFIKPGFEGPFLKDKNRKANNMNNAIHANIIQNEPISLSQPTPGREPAPMSDFIQETFPVLERPQTAPAVPDISSDATLPASDPALNEDDEEVAVDGMTNVPPPQSSPFDAINSSPPIIMNGHRRTGSSPSVTRRFVQEMAAKARSGINMEDSGYYSSLSSSVLRNNKSQIILTSELDVEPKKKLKVGRAEDEIRRMRSSSIDMTPSNIRFLNHSVIPVPQSSPQRSSPLQRNPTTPAAVFKKPALPMPESASPNTQLLEHRKAMSSNYAFDSPLPELSFPGGLSEQGSPFKWPTPSVLSTGKHFAIYDDTFDTPDRNMTPSFMMSPLKSVKRPTLARASKSANVLNEILGNSNNNKNAMLMPTLKPTSIVNCNGSPLKSMTSANTVFTDENDFTDLIAYDANGVDDFDENLEYDSDGGLDLGKGFDKIGGASNTASQRPGMGMRSYTSQW